MRAPESKLPLNNVAADSAAFTLLGGKYCIDAVATFGGGSLTLQRLGPDGVTQITATAAILAAGTVNVDLPPGQYKVAVATATAAYLRITRIPND